MKWQGVVVLTGEKLVMVRALLLPLLFVIKFFVEMVVCDN
jgi:hypothetical protein